MPIPDEFHARFSPGLLRMVEISAKGDMRSINGQLNVLVREALHARRLAKRRKSR